MILRLDPERLRRVMTSALPGGARAAEMFAESRVGLTIAAGDEPDPATARAEYRWERGAHLRRFSEGRHESFVLDAPTPGTLEALALHPEAIGVPWLARAGAAIPAAGPGTALSEVSLADAIPSDSAGPWSAELLDRARDLAQEWLDGLACAARGCGLRTDGAVLIEAQVQEILVVSTDRDVARDTRSFVDATLRARVRRGERVFHMEQTLSACTLGDLARIGADRPPGADLAERAVRRLEAVDAPRGEMPVVFASPSGGFLMHEICGHLLEADHVLRGASPFVGARGRAIASPLLSMADDGSVPGMRGSALFDDEGVAARRTPLLLEGTLVGYLSDRSTAFATDGISTGNGRRQSYRDAPMPRMTNLVIAPGETTPEAILRGTTAGLLVTRLGRGSVDPATGRFALAVEEAFLIEAGRSTASVAGALLRGRAGDLLPANDAVGCDARADTGAPRCFKDEQALPFGILQPTLRVASMTVTEAAA